LDPIFVTNSKARKEKSSSTGDSSTESPIYSINDHLNGKSEAVRDLFEQFREQIFLLSDDDSIIEKANKMYVGYKHGKNFCEVKIQSQGLKIWLDIPYDELKDPHSLGKDVTSIGHHGTGTVEVRLLNAENISQVMELIAQAYRQTI
jgi:predicted transport protein